MEKWWLKVYFLETDSLTFRIKVILFLFLVYAYDKKNHLFSEIVYGPRKKNGTKHRDPSDLFSGKIYHLKPEFV